MEIKIRYTWKQIKSGEIKQRIEYIENLECGQLLKEGCFMNPLWELIARDLWTGVLDKNKNHIFNGDVLEYISNGILQYREVYFDEYGCYWTKNIHFPDDILLGLSWLITNGEIKISWNIHINPINTNTNGDK